MRAYLLILILLLPTVTTAADGLNPDQTLNRTKISKAYFEGDFDYVVTALEAFRKANPNPTKDDKIYVYKYLSVIYAAAPETRGKAESYMYQLLKLMPSIELMDMYISDNIEAIFNSVRLRYERQQKAGLDSAQGSSSGSAAGAPSAGASRTGAARSGAAVVAEPSQTAVRNAKPIEADKPKAASKAGSKNGAAWVWWGAGAVGVAAAVLGFVYLSEPDRVAVSSDTLDF